MHRKTKYIWSLPSRFSENIGENLRTSNSEMFENNLEEAKK
jgi:hypothetical protein